MKKTFPFILFAALGTALFAQPSTQPFTASGNFVVPAGITSVTIEVVGAGGAGGINGGGGGGGGGYASGVYNVTPGATLPVAIGAAGAGPSGGSTSVGVLISATGGANGVSVSNPNIGGGGAGGVGSNGTISNFTGGAGGGGYWTYFGGGGGGAAGAVSNGSAGGNTIAWTGICQTPGGSAGASGGAPGGAGGKGAGFTDVNCNVTDASGNGLTYGGGGGGGNGNGGAPGTGSGGYCLFSWGGCVAPASPTITTPVANLSSCGPFNATLTATGNGTVNWYTVPSGSLPVATGSVFVTPLINGTSTVYYAEAMTCTNSVVRTTVTVTAYTQPTVAITSASVICAGKQATLNAGGANSYTWSAYDPATMTSSVGLFTLVQPTVTTSYTLTGTSADGCQDTEVTTLTVNALPSLSITATRSVICAGQSNSLTAGGAASYLWNTASGNTMIVVSPTLTTTYTLTGTGANSCTNAVAYTQTVSICAGINGITSGASEPSIYPNPNNGEFSIRTERDVTLNIVNELGQVVKTLRLDESNHHSTTIKGLPRGIYVVTEPANASAVRQKIVVGD